MQPLVSIIIPCYNQAVFLEETVASVMGQSWQNWECIVINDGSADHTEKTALALVEKDKRIRYLSQENKGVSAARNTAINAAAGKYIFPLDADDLISKDYLEACVNILEKDEAVKIVYCDGVKFGAQQGKCEPLDFDLKTMAVRNLIFNAGMFRRADWARSGGYDPYLTVGEDWELWINIIKNGGKVVKLPFTGFFYRIHAASAIRNYDWSKTDYLDFIYRKHLDFYLKVLGNPIANYKELMDLSHQVGRIKQTVFYKAYTKLKSLRSFFRSSKN